MEKLGFFKTNANSKEFVSFKDKQKIKGRIYSRKFLNSIKLKEPDKF